MNYFEFAKWMGEKIQKGLPLYISSMGRKEIAYVVFLALLSMFYVYGMITEPNDRGFKESTIILQRYGQQIASNSGSNHSDTLHLVNEREQVLTAIEERIVTYLYQLPDYSYIENLKPYLEYRPKLLEEFPSAVPLEHGEYSLSSVYGIRTHPISGKTKKHFGIDLAAPADKPVYAAASGIILDVVYSKQGYGIHVIIKHRFGFQTLYGHLSTVLVEKGQRIHQHELIGTVGNSGNSTGYHLHYEIVKNEIKIDPRPSLNLKREVYSKLIDSNHK